MFRAAGSKSKKAEERRKPLGIRTGDDVIVLSGEGKSDQPRKVLGVLPRENKVIVEGVNIQKDRVKPQGGGRQSGINQEGIVEKPMPIDRSNVALIDPKTKKPTRIRLKVGADGKRVRVAVKSGENI